MRSYFQKTHSDPKTEQLVSQIADLDILVTNSEIDALILESNLIKEHKPRYNIDLKDDKRFPYIKITTGELYPRLFVVRRMASRQGQIFRALYQCRGNATNAGGNQAPFPDPLLFAGTCHQNANIMSASITSSAAALAAARRAKPLPKPTGP